MPEAEGVTAAPLTSADRLHRVLGKVWPDAAAMHVKTGAWPNRLDQPRTNAETKAVEHSGAPYEITTLPDGRRRVRVFSADGDAIGAVGATIDEAIAALERKVGVTT